MTISPYPHPFEHHDRKSSILHGVLETQECLQEVELYSSLLKIWSSSSLSGCRSRSAGNLFWCHKLQRMTDLFLWRYKAVLMTACRFIAVTKCVLFSGSLFVLSTYAYNGISTILRRNSEYSGVKKKSRYLRPRPLRGEATFYELIISFPLTAPPLGILGVTPRRWSA